MGRILFTNGRVLPCTGANERPFDGSILIEGDRIADVRPGRIAASEDCRVIDLGGATVMPGLGDAHVHFGQPLDFEYDYAALMTTPADDGALSMAAVARTYLEHGVTTCVSGGGPPRGDIALKNVIDRGWMPGPRVVPGGAMISDPEGVPTMVMPTTVADMRKAVAEQCDIGVQVVKMFLSGETVMPPGAPEIPVERTFMNEALVEAAVDQAERGGAFISAHCRGAGSVTLAARCGVRLINHASYVDDEGLALLKGRDDVWVCPGIHYMWAMSHVAKEPYLTLAVEGGYGREYEVAVKTMAVLADNGIKLLPGGDYGHVWVPHGGTACDLQHFVERSGVSHQDAVLMGTRNIGELTGLKVGQLKAGYYADMLVLDGDPTEDIKVLQDDARRRAVVKGGELIWVNPDRIARV